MGRIGKSKVSDLTLQLHDQRNRFSDIYLKKKELLKTKKQKLYSGEKSKWGVRQEDLPLVEKATTYEAAEPHMLYRVEHLLNIGHAPIEVDETHVVILQRSNSQRAPDFHEAQGQPLIETHELLPLQVHLLRFSLQSIARQHRGEAEGNEGAIRQEADRRSHEAKQFSLIEHEHAKKNHSFRAECYSGKLC